MFIFVSFILMSLITKPAQTRGVCKVVGVDIDDSLIRAAWKRRRAIWSMQQPEGPLDLVSEEPPPKRARLAEGPPPVPSEGVLQPDYFPSSCEHMFGALPIPASRSDSPGFPHNIVFHAADWVSTEIPEDAEGYNMVIA